MKKNTLLILIAIIVAIPLGLAITSLAYKDSPIENTTEDSQNLPSPSSNEQLPEQPQPNPAPQSQNPSPSPSTSINWLTYNPAQGSEFQGIHYPSNFYVQEENEGGKILFIQSASGVMMLPGEGTECAYDNCQIVDGGLMILISPIDPQDDVRLRMDGKNLEQTPYPDIQKVKDLSQSKYPLRDRTNLSEMYYFTRPQDVYRVEVYENNFSGNSKEIVAGVLNSLSSLSEKKFGYVKKVYQQNGKEYLDINSAQIFFGGDANKAAQEDKQCASDSDECVPNGLYIRHNANDIITLAVSPDIKVKMATYDISKASSSRVSQQQIDYSKFKAIFSGDKAHGYLINIPYYFEIKDGQVIKITEQYLP